MNEPDNRETERKQAADKTPTSSQSSQEKSESCLLNLPSFNKANFSMYDRTKALNKRPVVYISTKKETDAQPQVIVPDKRNLLMKYYTKRWHYIKGAQNNKKREHSDVDNSEDAGPSNKHLRTT